MFKVWPLTALSVGGWTQAVFGIKILSSPKWDILLSSPFYDDGVVVIYEIDK